MSHSTPKLMAIGLLISSLAWAVYASADSLTGIATTISDGDTFKLQTTTPCRGNKNCSDGRQTFRIRLANIDAPEKAHPNKAGQAYGEESGASLYQLIAHQQVRVEVQNIDRYGRLIGDVFVGNSHVNAEQVRSGNAWVYTHYNHDASLVSLEHAAKDAGKGLWALPDSERMPPWEWRRIHKGD